MVYYSDTYELCHSLTEYGKDRYRSVLEKAADEILFKHEHPFKWAMQKIADSFNTLTSEAESVRK